MDNFSNLIFTFSTFSIDSLIRVLMNHRLTNFSNGIEYEKRDVNPKQILLLFSHKLNLLDSLTQFAGPSVVHTGNPPVPGSDRERGIGRKREWERRVTYVNDLPLLSAKGAIHLAWPWSRRKQHLEVLKFLYLIAFLNLSNTRVRPCE